MTTTKASNQVSMVHVKQSTIQVINPKRAEHHAPLTNPRGRGPWHLSIGVTKENNSQALNGTTRYLHREDTE